jgi:Fe-S-cluster-containing hydrogenase component 2
MQGSDRNANKIEQNEITRREFLATAASGFVALGAIGIGGFDFLKTPVTPIDRESSGVVFPDPSLCIGCLTCEVQCTDVHRKAGMAAVARIRIFNEPSTKLNPEILKNYPGRGTFIQQPCLQCPDSPCVGVCPVNALHVEPKTGARVINENACIACGRCAEACPFTVRSESVATNETVNGQKTRIIYDPQKNVFAKCDLCYFREGGPACVDKCPVNIRIRQGIVKSDRLCLELPKSDQTQFLKMKEQQTVKKT